MEIAKEKEIVTWPDFAISLYDKLTGRQAEISYEFENLEVSVPNSYASDALHANWKFNGTVRIRSKDGKDA
ncbi:MAG: hypothetical protein JSW56_08245 [Deltaproteobacteria bacterium]|nr:MAG: hypothetical protein JSW56_08245 [Deltaproteobacteria bacterium]